MQSTGHMFKTNIGHTFKTLSHDSTVSYQTDPNNEVMTIDLCTLRAKEKLFRV